EGGSTATERLQSDTGFNLDGALGMQWGPLRLEGQGSYLRNSARSLTSITTGDPPITGSTQALAFIGNAIYDFAMPPWWGGVTPPPLLPGVPAAMPAPARQLFLVFFDWDRDTITPEGMAVIGRAAEAYRAGGYVQLMVTGYTDRSGSPGYNQRLSERRANNVA